jgi:hypothetical protein
LSLNGRTHQSLGDLFSNSFIQTHAAGPLAGSFQHLDLHSKVSDRKPFFLFDFPYSLGCFKAIGYQFEYLLIQFAYSLAKLREV